MKKIALCFLTYDNLAHPKLWEKFIDNRYNVYIHNKNDFTSYFDKYCISDKVDTKWGHISLVKATLKLFKEAYKNEENEYFVLLSDKCIPLYNSNIIYEKISKINDNILDCAKKERGTIWYNYKYQLIKDKSFLDKNNFYGQSAWMILKRDTVNFFINNDFTRIWGDKCRFPDETYFVNIMNKFNISYRIDAVTYVNWKEKSESKKYRPYPKIYTELTNETIKKILDLAHFNGFFMRKVPAECELPSYFDNWMF